MGIRTLVISDSTDDLNQLNEILRPMGFDIQNLPPSSEIEDIILKDAFEAILIDYDLTGGQAYNWIRRLQENRLRSCFLLYGDDCNPEKITEMLQKGAYGFVPRKRLSERLYDTIISGLENRKAFIEILEMMDQMIDFNERLQKEKEALRRKNEKLSFINRLSKEVAYDLNWDRILPKILDAGLLKIIHPEIFGILFRIGSKWNLSLHLSQKDINRKIIEQLKKVILEKFSAHSGETIDIEDVTHHLYPSDVKISSSSTSTVPDPWTCPLSLAGKPLGLLVIHPKDKAILENGNMELLSTISNILAISLKNAQEYHRMKEISITDGLTGIYNHKAFRDFLKRELGRARRYGKSLSLIMIDMDHFKAINDNLGHQAGDYVLRELVFCLKRSVRESDILARYGGDEFAIILPETQKREAEKLIRRMIDIVERHPFTWGDERLKITISYGVSATTELQKDGSERELIHLADSMLCARKRSRQCPLSRSGKA